MEIRNKRPDSVDIAHADFSAHVEGGGTVEVPDHVGESLVQQVDAWEQAHPVKATKGPSKENS